MRLVLIGDLHYSEMDGEIDELQLARDIFHKSVLKEFLDIDADVHVSIGDLTNLGKTSELQNVYEILKEKERKFIHVLGNHDLYTQTREAVLNITQQARYHSITTEEAVLVFLDTAKEMDQKDWSGSIDEEQLQWFENVVETSGTKPMLVFAHHPVYETTFNSEKEKASIHPSIDMWRILNKKRGVGLFLNGHVHVDSIVKQKNWNFIQISACLDQHAFRLVELEEDIIRISTIDVTDEAVKKSAKILHNNMKHFKHNLNAYRGESNRECIITIEKVTEK